jgi:putative tricarboxylic transport membrane protein
VGTLPFWAATGLFVFCFIMVFECWLAAPRKPLLQSLPWALGLAVVTAAAVTLVFERAFLVRLP